MLWILRRIALLRASRRAFLGIAWRQSLGRFCLAWPPPFLIGLRMPPVRALPVPFWRNILRVEPATSPRASVRTVPCRWLAWYMTSACFSRFVAHLAAELGLVDLDRVDLLAGLVVNRDFDHGLVLSLSRCIVDFDDQLDSTDIHFAAFTLAVMLLRTKRSPPFGPGRAPLISSRLFSASIFTSGWLRVVTWSMPMWPAMRTPFLGLPRLAAPGGARRDRAGRAVLTLGAVRRALATEVVPLHDAGEALALAGADDVDVLHAVEDLDVDGVAGLLVGRVLQLISRKCRFGPTPALAAWPISGKVLSFGLMSSKPSCTAL